MKDLSDKLLQQNPDSFDGHRLRGQIALLSKDPAGAVKEFEIANKVKPYQTDLVLVYFQALVLNDQFPEAEKLAQGLIAREKAYSPIYDLLYVQYARRSDVPAAEQLMKLKVANNPTQSRSTWFNWRDITYFTGREGRHMDAVSATADPDGEEVSGRPSPGGGLLQFPAKGSRQRARGIV